MSRKKDSEGSNRDNNRYRRSRTTDSSVKNKVLLKGLLTWFLPESQSLSQDQFHGNVKWKARQLVAQALIWSWQDTTNVTDALDRTLKLCGTLGMKEIAKSYTSMMNALNQYQDVFFRILQQRLQELIEEVGGAYFRKDGWVPIGFDGSRATAPRTVSNERAFCAPNFGKGTRAKYGRKKSQGMRRKRNKQKPAHPQVPQAWITMMWHMGLRLPWTWQLGPSNSRERGHVMDMLKQQEFPENTLFCGDAGFVGYRLWRNIIATGQHFLVRVGANVNLLSQSADIKKKGGGIVLCWPKGKMASGDPPLRLRLVRVKIGKTRMWILTSVVDGKKLNMKMIVRFYRMRWGIEVEFRGLKQTLDKHKLRCRNSQRLLVELDWSIRAMAIAELLALREQIPDRSEREKEAYDPKDRSLANTMRAIRNCLRNLNEYPAPGEDIREQLGTAKIQRYNNRTDKRARYQPKNPDKKPLGDPGVRKLNAAECKILVEFHLKQAA